jgi:hypothetical protein
LHSLGIRRTTRTVFVTASLVFLHFALRAQTTQGLITGRVVNSRSARPVAGAEVKYQSRAGSIGGEAVTGTAGYFNLPLLSPGFYHLHVEAAGFQPQELEEVELAVAGRLDFNFRLRPLSDVWEAGQYRSLLFPGSDAAVTFFGPDVDISRSGAFDAARGIETALDASLSTVIDQQLIANLPLNGRDVYTLLATQPGVTADTTTARGLGLAINGQRPSVSNFLLDGIENNNYLVTGPLTQLSPEAIEEYRISTTNYSAEYGRTSGFVANAITRAAGTSWHGLLYDYQKTAELDANGFQENANSVARLPLKGTDPGFFLGGPILRNRLFVSAAFEVNRFRTKQDPATIKLPTTAFVQITTTGAAHQLLQQYAPPPVTNGASDLADLTVEAPVSTNLLLASPRVDYLTHNGASRLLFRSSISRADQPDFGWTPYSQFITPFVSNSLSLAGAWLWNWSPSLANELRAGLSTDEAHFNRPHPDVPILAVGDGTELPGSPLAYSYRNHGRNIEVADNLSRTSGRHTIKFGGGFLTRTITGYVTVGQDGDFGFNDALAFAQDQPVSFYVARLRQQPNSNVTPNGNREYRQTQFSGFAQDSVRVTPRLAVNFGVRYENFGSPANTGSVKDALFQLGNGSSLERRIASAQMVYPGQGNQTLYDADNRGIAVRAGFSYGLGRDSNTVMRGGFGIFYDRPFDNLWETLQVNSLLLEAPAQPAPFLLPVAQAAAAVPLVPVVGFPYLTLFQPGLRNAYAENGFWGIEHRATGRLVVQANLVGSFGRELVTTDLVNRPLSVAVLPGDFTNPSGMSNPKFPLVAYRANQGLSDYYGVQAVARYRSSRLQLQASYTWSHTIDNQSEPLAGEFFDFSFTANAGAPSAAFTRQFDSSADRANSDFDQRHNVVAYGVWEIPPALAAIKAARVFRDWTLGGLTAIRSGFPYSPLASTPGNAPGQYYLNNRADLVNPAQAIINTPVKGGVQILNPAAFTAPAPGQVGNLGRNAFRGPGLYNADISLSRRFRLAKLGESGRLTLRADAFNLLNHANLNNPVTTLGSQAPNAFGSALYGRQGFDPGFPTSAPLNEAPRQIQIMVRLEF